MAKIIVGGKKRIKKTKGSKRALRKKEKKLFEFFCKLSRRWPYAEELRWGSSKSKAEIMILV